MKKITNKNQISSTDIYESIEIYANRRNTLRKIVDDIKENGFTPAHIESELASIDLAEVITELRDLPTKEAVQILNKQIEKYENLIKRLIK